MWPGVQRKSHITPHTFTARCLYNMKVVERLIVEWLGITIGAYACVFMHLLGSTLCISGGSNTSLLEQITHGKKKSNIHIGKGSFRKALRNLFTPNRPICSTYRFVYLAYGFRVFFRGEWNEMKWCVFSQLLFWNVLSFILPLIFFGVFANTFVAHPKNLRSKTESNSQFLTNFWLYRNTVCSVILAMKSLTGSSFRAMNPYENTIQFRLYISLDSIPSYWNKSFCHCIFAVHLQVSVESFKA